MKISKLPVRLIAVTLLLVAAFMVWLKSGWGWFGLVAVTVAVAMTGEMMKHLPLLLTLGSAKPSLSGPDVPHGYLWQRLESALFESTDGVCELEDPNDSMHTLQLSRIPHTGRGIVYSIVEQREEYIGVASIAGNRYRTTTDEYELARHAHEITHRHYVQTRTSSQARLPTAEPVTCTRVESLPAALLATVEHALLYWPPAD